MYVLTYCYEKRPNMIDMNDMKNDKQKLKQQLYMSTNTGKCHEIVTHKSATSTRYTHINKPIEHLNNNNNHKRKARITTRKRLL